MPTLFIPTTYIGYTPTGVVNSPLSFTTSTGATLSFPNLYADIAGIPWLFGGTAWAGTRYYKRESVYISDFFYWNPSGVGAGIEDINLGKDLRLSYAAFAVDGGRPPPGTFAPPLALQSDFGLRNDLQLRGIKFWESGEFQIGFQYIANYSNNPATHGGWGVTLQLRAEAARRRQQAGLPVRQGGGNGLRHARALLLPRLLALQRPRASSGFGSSTCSPFNPATAGLALRLAVVFQHDDLGNSGQVTDWLSAGARVSVAFTEHFKLLGEAGYDRVTKSNGSPEQYLTKLTIAPTISSGRGLLTRPELRLFFTWAVWNEAARIATIDSGMLFTNSIYLSASTFGVQAETWW